MKCQDLRGSINASQQLPWIAVNRRKKQVLKKYSLTFFKFPWKHRKCDILSQSTEPDAGQCWCHSIKILIFLF